MQIKMLSSETIPKPRRLNPMGWILLWPALLLLSCASGPQPQRSGYGEVLFAPGSISEPGSLLEFEVQKTIPSMRVRLMLVAASPWLVGTQVKMNVLQEKGYADWYKSRAGTLSDIQPVRIAFTARLPEGGCERQSGTIFVPVRRSDQTRTLTWLVFAKGTELRRDFTPSRGKGRELPVIEAAASLGYAVWVPDYSGMGDGQGTHKYCVAESLADSSLDGLAAARQWLGMTTSSDSQAYRESGRLAIIGYSEGGLAAMGSLIAISEGRIQTPGLSIESVYPMGAPLNLILGVSDLGEEPLVLSHPEYMIFLALGWSQAYPKEVRLSDIFLPRTIEKILPMFDGARSDEDLNRLIPATLGKKAGAVTDADIFTQEYLSALRRDPQSNAYARLQAQARLDQWTPPTGVPIILAATPTDETVPFANSQNEFYWAAQNAPAADVSLVRLASSGHISAGIEAFLYAIVDLDKREAIASGSGG